MFGLFNYAIIMEHKKKRPILVERKTNDDIMKREGK